MTDERTPFAELWDGIVSGWMLVDDHDQLTERIEKLGDLMKRAGVRLEDLDEVQRSTVELMIQTQVSRAVRDGHFGPELAELARLAESKGDRFP